jgi:PST family polysaccharide transporter
MKNLLKASVITGAAFLANLIFNVIRSKIVAVLLGPGGVAVLAQLGGFTSLVIGLGSLGLAAAIVRFVAEYRATNRFSDLKKLIATTAIFLAVSSLITTVALLVLTPQIATFIFGHPTLLTLVALTLLNIPVSVLTNMAVSLLQGFKEIKLDAIFSVFSTIVTGALTIVLLIPFGLTGAVVAMLIANYLTSAVFLIFVIRSISRNTETRIDIWSASKWRRNIEPPVMRPLIGIATASLVGGGITNLADILIRSRLIQQLGLTVAGAIQPALTFSIQYTGLLSGAVNTYAVPRLSELSIDRERFTIEYNDYVRLLLLLITPAAIILAALAKFLVPLLYSSAFALAIPLVSLQSIADVLKFCFVGITGAFLPMGRGKILLFMGILIPFMYYGFFLLLLPSFGIKAVPISSGLSWAVASLVGYLIMMRTIKIKIFAKNFWLMINSILATLAVAYVATKVQSQLAILIVLIILGVWTVTNISNDEFQKIKAVISARFGRS